MRRAACPIRAGQGPWAAREGEPRPSWNGAVHALLWRKGPAEYVLQLVDDRAVASGVKVQQCLDEGRGIVDVVAEQDSGEGFGGGAAVVSETSIELHARAEGDAPAHGLNGCGKDGARDRASLAVEEFRE
jgi:hypothetical protein